MFNREKKSAEEFEAINREHMAAFKDSIFAYGWFYPVIEFLSMLALALMLLYGGFRISEGAMSVGVLVAFFQYGMRFFRPIQDLSEKYNILQSAMAAAERVFKLLDTPVEVTSPASPITASSIACSDRVRPCVVCLQRGRLGPAGRKLSYSAGRDDCSRWPYGRGQDDADEPAAAVL